MHANDKIAAFRDPNKTRVGWWCKHAHYLNANFSDRRGTLVKVGDYTGPDFATDDLACFEELEPTLLAMDAHVHRYKDGTGVVWMGIWISDTEALKKKPYAAAVSAAFTWAMDNQPDALRRAGEEVG